MAEDKKITQLGVMTQAGPLDVLPIVNVSGTPVTEQITTTDLFASPQPIGSSNESTGKFSSLELSANATVINEFSTDVTLAGDSDTAIPTERAVKAYVDASIPAFVPDRIEAGDSGVVVADSTTAGSIDVTVDGSLISTFTALGLQLSTGARINEISTDTTLADLSDTAVPTERAVRIYVDSQIATLEVQSDKNDYMLPPQEIAQNSIYTLTETAKISALYDQQLPKITAQIPAIGILKATPGDIEDLENGNYAVTTTNGVDCFLSIIGPDGTTIIDNKIVSDLDTDGYDQSDLIRLQNGKIAVLYSASSGGLKFRFYDPDGNVLDSTSQNSITTNVVGQYRGARLTNEKFFVVFSDVTDGQTKYIIINEDGTQFIAEQVLHTAASNYIRAATLTNGNIIVTYQDSGDNYLYFKIIDPAGVVSVGKTQVSNNVCVAGLPDQPVDVLSLPNGNAFITYADNTLNAKFKVFNGYGAEIIGETTYVSGGNIHWIAASYLPDGRVFAVAYNASTPLTYYTLLNRDGSTITQWTENSVHHQHLYSVIGKSGKIATVWVDTTDPNAYVELYSGLGTKVDGWFELATGVRVNEISNDTTMADASQTSLVTEYAAKSYVDTQIGIFSTNKIWQGKASVTAYDNTAEQAIIIEAPTTVPGPDSTAVQILYYNSLGGSNWVNSTSMVDGNIGTFARAGYTAGMYVQTNDTLASFDSTAISVIGTVQKVEMRVYAINGGGDATSAYLFARFNGTTLSSPIDILAAGGYTPWVDITTDPNGPGAGNWTWTDVQNMESQLEANISLPGGGGSDYFNVSLVQVRVTTLISGPGTDGKVQVGKFDESGLQLTTGTIVNEFTNDTTLADSSPSSVPTENAVKTYVDNKFASAGSITVSTTSTDTTAVNGDAILVDTTAGNVNIVMTLYPNAKIIIKKISSDSNVINVTVAGGLIDGVASHTIDSVYKAFTFISDGINYYVV